jgi:hypothetical protein
MIPTTTVFRLVAREVCLALDVFDERLEELNHLSVSSLTMSTECCGQNVEVPNWSLAEGALQKQSQKSSHLP